MNDGKEFKSKYTSKKPDTKGYIEYTKEENSVWADLCARQIKILPGRACDVYMKGLEILKLSHHTIPQLPDVNAVLKPLTRWTVEPVPALIPHNLFFELLRDKKFPAATFIRSREEFDYVTEPDIFHEIFGHIPMLTDPVYADFMHEYAKLVLSIDEKEWPLLQRTYWFTVEFGLIMTNKGLRAYGGGILSSPKETVYCVESNIPLRILFGDGIGTMRMPYRIDQLQVVYWVIHSFEELFDFIRSDVKTIIKQAHARGEYPPHFPVDDSPSVNIHFC